MTVLTAEYSNCFPSKFTANDNGLVVHGNRFPRQFAATNNGNPYENENFSKQGKHLRFKVLLYHVFQESL